MKNKDGIMDAVNIILMLVIAGVAGSIGIFIMQTVDEKTSLAVDTPATGTFTFSGNVSNGELVNITYGAVVYRFEFNTTANGSTPVCLTPNCISVNLQAVANGEVWNTSVRASGNLTAAINANASTAALVAAVNTTNVTTLTAVTTGTGGNSITLSDNAAAIASSGLSGGVDGATYAATRNSLVDTVETGFDLVIVVVLAAIGSIAIGYIFGIIPGRRKD